MDEFVWHRPKRCDTGSCPEVAWDGTDVLVRSSDRPSVWARFTAAEWDDLVAAAKAGEFDHAG